MLCCYCKGRVTFEWNLSAEHLEEDDAQCVDVSAMVNWLTIEHLRCHIFRCPQQHTRAGQCCSKSAVTILDHACNAEIGQHQSPIGMEQEVAWLQVTMYYPVRVGVIERGGSLVNECCHFWRRKRAIACQQVT